jgi:mono/diheme cytochrome c family protein
MLIAFLVFWVLLGLGVFFLAMRKGGAGHEGSGESRVGRGLANAGIVLVFGFGLIVPAFVLADNGAHKASVAVGGVRLNGQEQKGRELFAKACGVCHTLAAVKSVGRIGPNLDYRVGDEISTAAGRRALVLNAITEGRALGRGDMPAQLYVGKEAEQVAEFVAAVAGH